ncbi:MAG TPA: metal ABC transporter ATP-binding protein, partial [Candidatus Paceibacterota bacterium]
MESDKILEVKNLTVDFGDFRALEEISFDVEKDDSLAIIGPNGSGKTVLLKAILGTVKYSGSVKWNKNIKIGYVPQRLEIDRSLPMTVEEFLETKANILKIGLGEIKKLLYLVNLPEDILKRPIGQISSGQFQRALILFALVGDPNVLLFDEPTASVDEPSEEQIYETLHKLQDEKRMTIIIVSHDLSLVYKHSNKVLCINKNKVCFGEPADVLTSKQLYSLYGGEHKYYHHMH